MSSEWETFEIPRGTYYTWGNQIGQQVVGKVTAYKADGGTAFDKSPCPLLEVELSEATVSVGRNGDEPLDVGEAVTLTAGQVRLKRLLLLVNPAVGDLIEITLTEPSAGAGVPKDFKIRVKRGSGIGEDEEAPPDDEPPPDDDDEPWR
jgi:hypothetical protein